MVVEGSRGCLPAQEFSCDFWYGSWDPQTCPNFHLWQMTISIQNSITWCVRSGPKMSKTRYSKDGCTFSPNIFVPTTKITPNPHFGGPLGAKPIIQRALCKLHVNGATKLKLYSYNSLPYMHVLWGMLKFFR